MNDGILYTHNVVRYDSHGMHTMHVCVKLETAEYLRDWEMADEQNRFENSRKHLSSIHGNMGVRLIERMRNGCDKFGIVEGEVIL